MKKAKIFLGCLLIFISCNSRKENSVTEDVVVICGKITHPTDSFLIVFEDTVKVTGEGEFYIKQKINKSGYYKLSYNNEYTDLYDINNKPLGTRVFLHIPIFVLNPPIEPPYSLKNKVSAIGNTPVAEQTASDDSRRIKPFVYSQLTQEPPHKLYPNGVK